MLFFVRCPDRLVNLFLLLEARVRVFGPCQCSTVGRGALVSFGGIVLECDGLLHVCFEKSLTLSV